MAKKIIISFFLILCNKAIAQQPSYLSIRSVLDIAQKNSLFLKYTRYNIEITGADRITAGLRPNPIFNHQNLFLLNRNSTSYSSLVPINSSHSLFDSENNQLWFQLTKPMQIGGQRKHKISSSLQGFEISKLNYEKSESDYLFGIANQFIHASILFKNLLILTEIKSINDSIVAINENKLKNGMISSVDVTRIQLASEMYLLKTKLVELDYQNDISKLKYELGIDDSIILEELNTSNNYNFSTNPDSIISQGYSNRYDILIAQCSTSYYSKNISLQKSLAYPYVEAGVIANPQNSVSYVGTYATVGIPVYDRNQGNITKAQVLYEQSQTYLESIKSKANTSILNAYSMYLASKEIAEKYSETLTKAKLVFKSVKYNYIRGNTNILDFLDAEKSYLNLSIQYKDALSNYQVAYINLLYNLGLIKKI